MFTYLGLFGVIRREAIIPDQFMWASADGYYSSLSRLGFGQITFAYNLFKTLGRKTTPEEQFNLSQIKKRERRARRILSHSGESSTSAHYLCWVMCTFSHLIIE